MEEEIIEVIPEEVIEEEIIDEESETVVPVEPDPQESEPTEEELLLEYIKQELLKDAELEETDELEQIEGIEMQSELLSVGEGSPDYTEQLDDIQTELNSISVYMENDILNNQMDSSVDNISLTNSLLLVTIVCVLFSTALNFARRIF